MADPLFGCIEAGGTKFVVGVLRDQGTILDECRIETSDPAATIGAATDFLDAAASRFGSFDAIGIASFGPID
ncbi:MAG: ROK family protein, partial [Alphaproteobacteria bacterium]